MENKLKYDYCVKWISDYYFKVLTEEQIVHFPCLDWPTEYYVLKITGFNILCNLFLQNFSLKLWSVVCQFTEV